MHLIIIWDKALLKVNKNGEKRRKALYLLKHSLYSSAFLLTLTSFLLMGFLEEK